MKTIKAHRSSDGKVFENADECLEHEKMLKVRHDVAEFFHSRDIGIYDEDYEIIIRDKAALIAALLGEGA